MTRPELKAHALEEAVTLLASCDPDEVSDAEGKLIANLRTAHTRRLLVQLVGLARSAWTVVRLHRPAAR
jgi:hypothetical protein